ncbi:hypothetical protein EHN06_00895 [Marinobacter sp. NP-4(2019)]|uniref:hypothetical protein n=1 Tax=Marinobacter sp. NP-4(2019) TaxID=2488665 RepID=UPI000FC3ED7A|nr:hypothetical protein [Marinobacter sp. NP-4(2019)]AZT82217.1 hypothetical protein EHN06_00895 [Marinobacter sp. NP-4(2019)]
MVEEGAMLARQATIIPLLEDKRALQGKVTAYVCEQGMCELPAQDVSTFVEQITRIEPLFGTS